MAKKPNYHADRIERERAKAAKKAKRMEARAGKTGKQREDAMPAPDESRNESDLENMPDAKDVGPS